MIFFQKNAEPYIVNFRSFFLMSILSALFSKKLDANFHWYFEQNFTILTGFCKKFDFWTPKKTIMESKNNLKIPILFCIFDHKNHDFSIFFVKI